jgi:hypothetical protein
MPEVVEVERDPYDRRPSPLPPLDFSDWNRGLGRFHRNERPRHSTPQFEQKQTEKEAD